MAQSWYGVTKCSFGGVGQGKVRLRVVRVKSGIGLVWYSVV